jgi:cytochrome c biogenesis protein CcmG, thiol:disulfide interchange protein DsbE
VNWDSEADARKFVQTYALPFPVGRDGDARIGTSYRVEATPVSVFIGKDGVLAERIVGEIDQADFEGQVAKLLAK